MPEGSDLDAAQPPGRPLRRSWIDKPNGEEETSRLEEEVLPAMEQFLGHIDEIDAVLEAAQEAEIKRVQATMQLEQPAADALPVMPALA